ncbi:MAG TPA: glycosyltransferase family 4 protein [Cyclobacteriaceae bacterium]|nr:glycosyltransferase family 4 protein [Cyclobacteriaceae bacterium]
MRILLVHQYFLEKDDPGGSRFNEMARLWCGAGHEVTVVCGMFNYLTGSVPEKYKGLSFHHASYSDNLRVLRCFVSPNYYKGFFGRLWAYFSFVAYACWGIAFKLKKEKYDVVIATSPPLFIGVIAWVASKIKRVPFVFEVRDLWPESAIETGVLTNKVIIKMSLWLERMSYKKSFLINVLTPAFKDRLISTKNVPGDKIIMIPNACDFRLSDDLLKNFDADGLRRKLGWEDKFIIVYVGVHGVANHLDQLLDAAGKMQETPAHFVLIGDGAQKKNLIAESQRRKLTNVEFIDSMPKREVMKYILAADVGASVLKKVDTFKTIYSNKTFDYMACKKPVLMLIDGVSRQLVEEAQCGVYAEPENTDEIVRAVETLRSSSIPWGGNGYVFAKANFDREVLAKEYIDLIQLHLNRV